MARAKKSSSDKPLALELLSSDHRKVEDLFEEYESAKEDEDEGRTEIAQRICKEITVHAQLEEEIFEAISDKREELDELGQEMAARKAELAEEHGLESDDAEGAMAGKKKGSQGGRAEQRR